MTSKQTTGHPAPRTDLHRDLGQVFDHLTTTRPDATIAELRLELELELELEQTLHHLVDGAFNEVDQVDLVRREEQALLLAALSTHPGLAGAALTVDTDPWTDPRRTTVLALAADTGSMTWHIDDRDVDALAHLPNHLPHDHVSLWDGADRTPVLARLREFTRDQAARQQGAAGPW